MFKDKHLKGKSNPCDYSSRHPTHLDGLSQTDTEKLGVDDFNEVPVMWTFVEDMPMAITLDIRVCQFFLNLEF